MTLFTLWGALLALMVIQKPLFMLIEPTYSIGDLKYLPEVITHGLSMDISMSAYLSAPILLWLIAGQWINKSWMPRILHIYLAISASLIGIATVVDAALYPYWGFRLDTTPLFYFTTSPSAAFASLPWWANISLIIVTATVCWACYRWLLWAKEKATKSPDENQRSNHKTKIAITTTLAIVGALMIIPIRGGITVSTMSPARAYFSDRMELNHAAINPLFSFMYSLSHNDNLAEQFRFMDDTHATSLVKQLLSPTEPDSTVIAQVKDIRLNTTRPDIYIIILESFSAHIMPSLGGEAVAVNLDRIAKEEGVLFTNFYAESFRTDRALPAILSGYPAQPSTSALRYINKFTHLPSLALQLKKNGYTTHYYYGGDIDFTNLKAYLIATGYDRLTADTDFDLSLRTGKWGVQDQYVFDRILSDQLPSTPNLIVIQTSSSHEPFDVPYNKLSDKRANAFAYADNCLGQFITGLKKSGQWNNALVVITGDHWGSYPPDLKDYEARHHIPLVLTGGALDGTPSRVNVIASQSAIASTITTLLGIANPTPQLSLLDPQRRQFAWICEPDWLGIKTPRGLSIVDANTHNPLSDGPDIDLAKAFVQKLYDDLDRR